MVWRSIYKVLVLLALGLSGYVSAEPYTVVDKLGRSISVDIPVRRAVIALSYELIPALDIWDRVVGVSSWAQDHTDVYKALVKLNPSLRKPTIGIGTSLNVEAILKLNPDVVITWTYTPETIAFLENKGVKVIGIYPESLEEFYEIVRLHGKLFGKEKEAEKLIEEMESYLRIIRERVSGIPFDKQKRVLHLLGTPTTVSCASSIANDLINIIGALNPASSIREKSTMVSVERIVQWNPDTIFIWGNAGYGSEWFIGNSQWKHIKAVKEKSVYKLPEWSTWSPRVVLIAFFMAKRVYPELFKDIDFGELANRFYHKIFGISYDEVFKILGQ